MKLYNKVKLRFSDANWALHPELATFDICLNRYPKLIKFEKKDVL